ncbi:helix-turn-helix domain-containing protein [Paenibacillus humicola]|uniref:helix-turn-helix domain-containing protein n=1 Tax=Paenibacillus humicola TaxID=3110540 RepID=UPI00237C4B78|nr:helix-turn-helix domain-containing protein [Paenibacillus humicola]
MLNLLIVEDEAPFREGLLTMVDWAKLDIRIDGIVENGFKALSYLESGTIDILLTDIRMPILDGLQLIAQVNHRKLDTACVLISGYNDFDNAQKAIRLGAWDFLTKPCSPKQVEATFRKVVQRIYERHSEQDNVNQLLKHIPIAKSHVLLQWLHHPLQSFEHRIERMAELNMRIHPEQIVAMAVTLDRKTYNQLHYSQQDLEILTYAAANIVQETLERVLLQPVEVVHDDLDIAVVINGASESMTLRLRDGLRAVQANLNAYLKLTSSIGISGTHASIDQLNMAYREAREALQFRFYQGTGKEYYYRELCGSRDPDHKTVVDWEQLNMEQSIVEHLRSGLFAEALNVTETWLGRFQQVNTGSIRKIHIQTMSLLTRLIQLAEERDLHYRDWAASYLPRVEQMEQIETIDELSGLIYGAMREFIELLNPNKTLRRIVQQAVRYIEANYNSSELSLSGAANELFVSNTYLSTLFKQELGINFLDYAHQYRIEKAKGLLQAGNAKIHAVAKELGYFDEAHFTRTFKKWAGMSPSQYRKTTRLPDRFS